MGAMVDTVNSLQRTQEEQNELKKRELEQKEYKRQLQELKEQAKIQLYNILYFIDTNKSINYEKLNNKYKWERMRTGDTPSLAQQEKSKAMQKITLDNIEEEEKAILIDATIYELEKQHLFSPYIKTEKKQIEYINEYLNYNFFSILQKVRREKEKLKIKDNTRTIDEAMQDLQEAQKELKAINPHIPWFKIIIESTIKSKIFHNLFKGW